MLLVGEESAGIQTLRTIAETGHRIVAVMASPSTDGSKSATLWNVANRMGYTTWPAKFVKQPSFSAHVKAHHVDLLLNVHSLFIINADILSACRIGAYNLHPGPLPKYAGLNVPSWAIYFGETEHAVTVHQMVPEIDAGTIAYERRFPITDVDTGLSLMSKCVRAGVPLLTKLLDAASEDPNLIPRIEQDCSKRRYFGKEAPNLGRLSWDRSSADVVNHVRASDYTPFVSPWGHPQTWLDDREFGVVKASRTSQPTHAPPGTVGEQVETGIYIASAEEWVLVHKLQMDDQFVCPQRVLQPSDQLVDRRTSLVCS